MSFGALPVDQPRIIAVEHDWDVVNALWKERRIMPERHVVSLTTNASGAATSYTPVVFGRILGIVYVKTDFANGVDFAITLEATAEAVLTLTDQNASGVWYPRTQVHGVTGTGLTMDGTRLLVEPLVASYDRVKIVVAQGGDTKTGAVHVIVG